MYLLLYHYNYRIITTKIMQIKVWCCAIILKVDVEYMIDIGLCKY